MERSDLEKWASIIIGRLKENGFKKYQIRYFKFNKARLYYRNYSYEQIEIILYKHAERKYLELLIIINVIAWILTVYLVSSF